MILLLAIVAGIICYVKRREIRGFVSRHLGHDTPLRLLVIPLLMIYLGYNTVYELGEGGMNMVTRTDDLRKMETYAPLLGQDARDGLMMGIEYGLIPGEVDRSPAFQELCDVAVRNSVFSTLGMILILACCVIEIIGAVKVGKIRLKHMKICQWTAAIMNSLLFGMHLIFLYDYGCFALPWMEHGYGRLVLIFAVAVIVLSAVSFYYGNVKYPVQDISESE